MFVEIFLSKAQKNKNKKKNKEKTDSVLKGLVHPKMKIMSLMTHPHVVQSP